MGKFPHCHNPKIYNACGGGHKNTLWGHKDEKKNHNINSPRPVCD